MLFAALIATLLVSPLPHPDCQRFCLGVCAYDWATKRCNDSRVKYLGIWDGVQSDYVPSTIYDFPEYPTLWHPVEPMPYGAYPTELQPLPTP